MWSIMLCKQRPSSQVRSDTHFDDQLLLKTRNVLSRQVRGGLYVCLETFVFQLGEVTCNASKLVMKTERDPVMVIRYTYHTFRKGDTRNKNERGRKYICLQFDA